MALLNFFKRPKKDPEKKIRPPASQRSAPASSSARSAEPETRRESGAGRVRRVRGKARKSPKKEAGLKLKESKSAWRVLSEPHVTEKSTDLVSYNKYTFKVFNYATKPEVKRAIEDVYGVKVVSVSKISVPKKQRRRGRQIGWRPGYTKAIVTLKEGDKIEVLPH